MPNEFVEIDVREIQEEGRSPLPLIMNTVQSLEADQGLRLLTAWEPVPLYEMLGNLGFEHQSHQESEEFWKIDFTRSTTGNSRPGFEPPCIL